MRPILYMVRVRHIWLRRTAGQPSAGGSSVKYDYWEPGVGGDWGENLVVSGKILTKTESQTISECMKSAGFSY